MLFQAELLLEGVDDRLDPLAHPTQRPEPSRLILAVRTDEAGAQRPDVLFEGSTGKPLVGQEIVPAARACWRAAPSSNASATSRSPSLGVARHQVIGMPSGAQSRYSLKPQYQRRWLRSSP